MAHFNTEHSFSKEHRTHTHRSDVPHTLYALILVLIKLIFKLKYIHIYEILWNIDIFRISIMRHPTGVMKYKLFK